MSTLLLLRPTKQENVLAASQHFLCDIAMATSADVHWQSTLTLWNRRGRGGHNNQKQSLGATMASSGDTVWKIGGWIDAATVVPKEIDHATNARNIYLHVS